MSCSFTATASNAALVFHYATTAPRPRNLSFAPCPPHFVLLPPHQDCVPRDRRNDYAWKQRPTRLMAGRGNTGGAMQISHADYQSINGYSNQFKGWGLEDDNMQHRLQQRYGGYDQLRRPVGLYSELPHEVVWGLDETDTFASNKRNVKEMESGLSVFS